MGKRIRLASFLFAYFLSWFALSQSTNVTGQSQKTRLILTAVPFLTITPDTRSAGMGEVGVATPADADALFWNPAKLPFSANDASLSLSFTPWLKASNSGITLTYLHGYKKLGELDAVGGALTYFNLGNLQFTNNQGNVIQDFQPVEFAINIAYARKLSERLSMGVGARFIYSNLSGNFSNTASNINDTQPGISGSVDLSVYYINDKIQFSGRNASFALGANISNVGFKMSYNRQEGSYLPTNLRLGSSMTVDLDTSNSLTVSLDFNKLLVPTPGGSAPNVSALSALITSFYDAPSGLSEELKEVIINFGAEYWYNKLLALRTGYFHESAEKGNRQYFTLGFGIRYQKLGFDFSYIIVANQESQQTNPLEDTFRVSVLWNLPESANNANTTF